MFIAANNTNEIRNEVKFYGCFDSNESITLLTEKSVDDFQQSLTPRMCVGYCYTHGYLYAGLHKG